MPYLPPRRFRPAGSRVGQRPRASVANRPGFVDYTMPRWLRDALARAKGQQPPPPNFSLQGQPPPPRDQGLELQAAIDASAASRGRGTNRTELDRGAGGGGVGGFGTGGYNYIGDYAGGAAGSQAIFTGQGFDPTIRDQGLELEESVRRGDIRQPAGGFDFSFGRGDIPIDQDILNRAQGLVQVQERGPFIQDLDAPNFLTGVGELPFFRSIGEQVAMFLEPEFDSRFEGERGVLGLQNFVFPGTERFIGATEQFNHDRGVGPGTGIFNDLFGRGRGVGLAEEFSNFGSGIFPGLFGGGLGDAGITPRAELLAQYNAGIGRGPSTEQYFGAGPNLGGIDQYYSLLDPPPASFSGAGGFGGGGGFNFSFPEGDPADPRFWLDLVRWLI